VVPFGDCLYGGLCGVHFVPFHLRMTISMMTRPHSEVPTSTKNSPIFTGAQLIGVKSCAVFFVLELSREKSADFRKFGFLPKNSISKNVNLFFLAKKGL